MLQIQAVVRSRAWKGTVLAILAAMTWGTLPIAMKPLLSVMAPQSIVWFRFCIAAVVLGLWLKARGKLPSANFFSTGSTWLLLGVAAVGLGGNFVLFSASLKHLSPTGSQVMAQLSPVGLLFASYLILKERLRPLQILGAVLLLGGLVLFFNQHLRDLLGQWTEYTLGIVIGSCAALVWVCYGLAQKLLLRRIEAQPLLWILYLLCTVGLFPWVTFDTLGQLTGGLLFCLIYCGVNTVIGYGALAEAMSVWQTAPVSAIVTVTPLFTLVFSEVLILIWPTWFSFPTLNSVGYFGAFVVVAGAMCVAISPSSRKA